MKATMKRKLRSLWRADAGAATVEMALVAPILILLMMGIIEVGRYADYTIKVTNAARAGVQYGAQNLATASNTAGIRAAALGDAQSVAGLTATPQTFCTCADGSADANCVVATCPATNPRLVYVRVDTAGTISSLFNYTGLPTSFRTLTVSGLAIMRVAE
jgi:Flp pilus assembly protein TadG